MHTTGAGTKTTAIFFFMIFIARLRSRIFNLIYTGVSFGTRQARQNQHVQTKYQKQNFHRTKIMVLEKIFLTN